MRGASGSHNDGDPHREPGGDESPEAKGENSTLHPRDQWKRVMKRLIRERGVIAMAEGSFCAYCGCRGVVAGIGGRQVPCSCFNADPEYRAAHEAYTAWRRANDWRL